MRTVITLYFDLVCPYAYLASTQLAALEARVGQSVELAPILLGGVFRAIGQVDDPNVAMPAAKAAHGRRDLARWAQQLDVPLVVPAAHPRRTVLPMRVLTALEAGERRSAMHALHAGYWVHGDDVAEREGIASALRRAGFGEARIEGVLEAASGELVKLALRERTAEAVERGVFGVPSFVVDRGEARDLVWGQDRLDWVAKFALGQPLGPSTAGGDAR